MTCRATITVGDITVRCEMTGHTKPHAPGPTHMARIGRAIIRWPTSG